MNEEYIKVGRVCVSKAGHDKNAVYMISGIVNDQYVLLTDGRRKPIHSPKKKKVKHVAFTSGLFDEIAGRILSGGKVYDFEIAKALDEIKDVGSKKGKEG